MWCQESPWQRTCFSLGVQEDGQWIQENRLLWEMPSGVGPRHQDLRECGAEQRGCSRQQEWRGAHGGCAAGGSVPSLGNRTNNSHRESTSQSRLSLSLKTSPHSKQGIILHLNPVPTHTHTQTRKMNKVLWQYLSSRYGVSYISYSHLHVHALRQSSTAFPAVLCGGFHAYHETR